VQEAYAIQATQVEFLPLGADADSAAFRADDWLLYDQHPISNSGSRGLAGGSIYTTTGALAVTVVQEGLIRTKPQG
ncbi:MAG: hypothetical protein RJA51_796, partial [Actinomycetota bacterium]